MVQSSYEALCFSLTTAILSSSPLFSLLSVLSLCTSLPLLYLSLQVGQELEVRPGIVSKDHEGKLMCKPIFSKIVSLFAEHNDLQYAAPGGLIGMNLCVL